MALLQGASSFCLFCYNSISYCGDSAANLENIKSFTTNLFRFVGDRECTQKEKLIEESFTEFTKNSECLNCCEECQVIIDQFLQTYHQLKCLELQLDFQLDNLLGKIEVSSRVPKRWKNVRKIMEGSMDDSFGRIERSQYLILKIRQLIIKSGIERSTSSSPRVLVERRSNGIVNRSMVSKTVRDEIMDESTNESNTSNTADPVIKMELDESQSNISEDDANISTEQPTSTSVLNISSKAISKVCEICNLNCAPDKLDLHFKTYHDLTNLSNPDDIHRCKADQCKAYFLTKNQSNIHYMQKHHKPKKLGTLCIVYNDGVKYFLCKFCQSPFNQLYLLRRHLTTTSCGKEADDNEEGTPVECSECKETFEKKEDLWMHQSQVHSDAKKMVCPKCGKCFDRKWSFKLHLEYHKGPAEWKWKCVVCSKKFVNQDKLNRHAKSHKPTKRDVIRKQKAAKRNQTSKWQCKDCGRRLSSKYKLKYHMRMHTGERPYSCHLCEATFAYSDHLPRHLGKIHGVSDGQPIPTRPTLKKTWHGDGNEPTVDINSVEIEQSDNLRKDPLEIKEEAGDLQAFSILDEIY